LSEERRGPQAGDLIGTGLFAADDIVSIGKLPQPFNVRWAECD